MLSAGEKVKVTSIVYTMGAGGSKVMFWPRVIPVDCKSADVFVV